MSKQNKVPNFIKLSEVLLKNLQSDAGKKGIDFIHSNFETQGFTDSAFQAWPQRKQNISYNLLRVTNTLFNSINVESSNSERIVFGADAPYAQIHNEGGTLSIQITKKARKYFWFMYKQTGKNMWKSMALTKKERLSIKIPQRQFMGHSETFSKEWNDHVIQEILHVFKQHLN